MLSAAAVSAAAVLDLPGDQTVNSSGYAEGIAILLFICALSEPLILAHANGFTSAGLILPPAAPRSHAMRLVGQLCSRIVSASLYLPFLIGQYEPGAMLFAAPVDFTPPSHSIVRSSEGRVRALSAGAAFIWCTLAALANTPLGDPATRAILSCRMFQGPSARSLDVPLSATVEFLFGVTKLRSLQQRPSPDHPRAGAAARALHAATAADLVLRRALELEASDPLLEGWVDRITPLVVGEIPAYLLDSLPDFTDSRLDDVPLSQVLQPLTTDWYPLPPEQPSAPPEAPVCPKSAVELLTPSGAARLSGWIDHQLRDLAQVRSELALGVAPGAIMRDRPGPIAIGQSEFQSWARGRVWDCTFDQNPCCVVSSFHHPPLEIIDRAEVQRSLAHYPDQSLVSHLLLGARTDADVELQFVLVPHLTTLPFGFQSVISEVDRLESYQWYRSFPSIPYAPMYLNGQGATARKLEPDRWRRTTEGGGPRQATFDSGGVRALSLNEAARIYHMPEHFLSDQRPEFLSWLRQRGLPRANPIPPSDGRKHPTKWPKEVKPALEDVMRDMAVLGRAAARWDTALYCSNDDIKDYFNHLAVATSELSKVGILLDRADGAGPRFVSERVLGFGLHGSSNLAQRFSDSLVILYYQDMDAEYFASGASYSPAERSWLEHRLALQRREGEPCVDIYRWTAPPAERRPPIPAPATLHDVPAGYVCPQLRPYRCYFFTDDAQMFAVGVRVKLMSLRNWRRLTNRMRLRMAIPEKRSLGTWCKWIGVLLIPILGLVVVTRDKILRASAAIGEALSGRMEFHVYRALCGLLEHLRAVNLRGRNIMHGLYRPHGPGGASQEGPSGIVRCDQLMRSQLERWLRILTDSCGVSVKRALLRENLEILPSVSFELFSDACYADVAVPGVGGYLHGLYWYFPVPATDVPLLSIPILEFLGVAFNVLTFYPHLHCMGSASSPAWVDLYTDAFTTARVLAAESAKSTVIVEAYQHLLTSPEWRALYGRLRVAHLYGDANVLADLISRARWAEFRQLCAMLGVRPQLVATPAGVSALYRAVIRCLQERAHLGSTARGVFNPHLIGDQPIAQGAASVEPHPYAADSPLWHDCLGDVPDEYAPIYDIPLDLLVRIVRNLCSPTVLSAVSRAFQTVAAVAFPVRTCRDVRDAEVERQLAIAEWEVADAALDRAIDLGSALEQATRSRSAQLALAEWRAVEATLTYSMRPEDDPTILPEAARLLAPATLRAIERAQAEWRTVEATFIQPAEWWTYLNQLISELDAEDHERAVMNIIQRPRAPFLLPPTEPAQREPNEPEVAHTLPPSNALQARPTVTSTTLGSHNIAMDGRPLAHPPGSASSAPAPLGFAELLYAQLRATAPSSSLETPAIARQATPEPRPTLAPLASGHAAECLYKALTTTSSSPPHQGVPPTPVRSCAPAEGPSGSASPRTAGAREPSSKRRLYDPGPRRQVGDLQLPPAPPWVKAQSSGLALASSEYSRLRALAMAEGGEPCMAIRAELTNSMTITAAIDETVFFGINANTLDMDVRAWDAWERVCRSQGTSPLRTAAEARDFPERNAHLLACLLLHAFSTGRPRDRSRAFIKPKSALAYPLAVVRIFARWGVTMPSHKMLKAAVAGLSRAYLAYYGPMSLAPKRAEPMKFSMVRELYAIPSTGDSSVRIGGQPWSDADHNVFIFRRLICVMMVTAFRLGEIVHHASGEIMYLTFESLTWVIGGITISHPTAAQLASMRPGIDGARLAPPRSKPDQMGEIHCPFSVVLTYHPDDPINAAAALRDLELRIGCMVSDRGMTPLFPDALGEPYSHSFLHSMLRSALAHLYGEAVASLYSFHSFRSGLATALHAAGVSDAMIQLICRWMCPESLHVYRRMGVAEHEASVRKASRCHVDCVQSVNVPTVVGDQHMALLNSELGQARASTEQQSYEFALHAAAGTTAASKRQRHAPAGPSAAPHLEPLTRARRSPGAVDPPADVRVALEPLDGAPSPGTELALPRAMWPNYPCEELGGQGWKVLVLKASSATTLVRFIHARSRNRHYEDTRVPTSSLMLIKPLNALDQQGP